MPVARGDPLARLLRRFAALLAVICCLALGAGTYLVQATLHAAQAEAFNARFALVAQRVAGAAEQALALGVPMAPGTPLALLLAREAALEPALLSFDIASAQGAVLLHAPPPARAAAQPAQARAQLVRVAIHDDLGQAVAWVRLRYDDSVLHAARARLQARLWSALVPALALVCAGLAAWCAWRLRRGRARPPPGGERARLVLAAALLLGAALLWMGWRATVAGQAAIAPDQRAKAVAVARSSAALVARALEAGVPMQHLAGVPAHAQGLRAQSPEIVALGVVAPDGALLAGSAVPAGPWTVSAPVVLSGSAAPAAQVLLQLDPRVLARRLQATLLDIAFLGVVCLLLALEWVALGLGTRGARALAVLEARRQTGQRTAGAWRPSGAAAVRPALFLFMLSEELTRPFLPTWARTLAPAQAGDLPAEWLAGLPLVLFLAVVALLQWPLAARSERWGRRPGMVVGALLGAAGLACAALLPQFSALLGARLLGALGFALVFVSAQGAVIDASTSADRARSLGQFVRAILVAGLCGPPLGGMAAEHWGVPGAFALAAGVALLAACIARAQMAAPRRTAPAAHPATAPRMQPRERPGALLRQPGLLPLLLCCALPAKLLLAAVCFYLLPLHLQDLGHGSAVTGRLQTLYPLTMVLLVPLAARQADRWRRREAFVLAGGLLAGASAVLAWPAGQAPLALAVALLGLGLGQALSITPQSALVADMARSLAPRQGAGVLGLFRTTERGGSALGPLVGAWLLPLLGFGPAVAAIGAATMAASLAYGWSLRRARQGADT